MRIIFYITLSFLLLSACNQTNPKIDNLVRITLSAESLLEGSLGSSANSRLQKKLVVSLQDINGKTLTFDKDHKASPDGDLKHFTLGSESSSVTLYLATGNYLLNIHDQENLPYKQVTNVSTDGQIIALAPEGKYSEGKSVSAPDVNDGIFSLNLMIFGPVASVNSTERQLSFEGLNNINFAANDDTFYFHNEQGEVEASTFWAELAGGDLLVLDGAVNEDGITIFFTEKLTNLDPFLETGYMVVSGEISQLDRAAPNLAIKNLENLNFNFSNASYGNEFESFGAAKFWQRAEDGRVIMLEGTFKEQTLSVGHVFLPAKAEEIPPLPDGEEIGLEGEIIAVAAEAKELRLRSGWSRLEEVTVKTSADTLYYGGRGEITEQGFWSKVALGEFIFVEGLYIGGVLEAKTIFLNEIVEPIIWLEGKVKSFNKTTQILTIDSNGQFVDGSEPPVRSLGQLANSLEQPISSPRQPDIIPEQFKVSTTESTTYIDEQGLKITASKFWETLQIGDYLAIEGEFTDEGNMLALAIYKHPEPKLWFEGKVKSFDIKTQTLIIDNTIQFVGYPEPPVRSLGQLANSSEQPISSPGQPDIAEQFTVITRENTKYTNEQGLDVTAQEFWQALKTGDFLSVEGEFTDDDNVLALAIYKHPEPRFWFEGKVKSFDAAAQTLIIASTGQFIGGSERPAGSLGQPVSSPEQPAIISEQFTVITTEDTKYTNEQGLDITAKEFWEKLQVGDFLSVEGELAGDGNVLALAIYKYSEHHPIQVFEGTVSDIDPQNRELSLSELPELRIAANEDTTYLDELGEISAETFWTQLKLGDLLFVEVFPEILPQKESGGLQKLIALHIYLLPDNKEPPPPPTNGCVPYEYDSAEYLKGVSLLELMILESFPIQVDACVKSVHGDTCTDFLAIEQTIEGFDITLEAIFSPPEDVDIVCGYPIAPIPFAQQVRLETKGLPSGEYTVHFRNARPLSFLYEVPDDIR